MDKRPFPVISRSAVIHFILPCLLLLAVGACKDKAPAHQPLPSAQSDIMDIEHRENLIIFYPHFKSIDLVCKDMPKMSDESVIFCCQAAFTRQLKHEFAHNNIAGNHASRGKLYAGYPCTANTGAFSYHSGRWHFMYQDYNDSIVSAAKHGGMGFGQMMLIHEGERIANHVKGMHMFRALCAKGGKLCIVESNKQLFMADFIDELYRHGVRNAIYLDMGEGWNYSWYRGNDRHTRIIHPKKHDNSTNWLTFYQ